MRELSQPPLSVVDASTGRPRLGSYRGGLPRVDWAPLGLGAPARALRHKRWVYVAVSTEEVFVAAAVVRLGYAANAFAYAYDARSRAMLFRRSWLGARSAAVVGDTGGEGCRATFHAGGGSLAIERSVGSSRYTVDLEAKGIALTAVLESAAAPPAIGAIAEVAPGRFDATEKRALLAASGVLRVDGRTVSLDGSLAGYDFTSGMLARHTLWRWGFALGRLEGGTPFALNLVEGFVGEAECVAWVGGELLGLGEGRFTFDASRPSEPWAVSTADDAAFLRMTPGAVHEERRNLVVVASRFVQPCGSWSGELVLPGGPRRVDRALGVTEDQDVVW
ncbi:MAG TPA: DUF2804 family protein [Polyangiaceae bacterium]|jgi:hypothetical protein